MLQTVSGVAVGNKTMDSIECHLKDTCMKPQLNSSDQNFQQFIKLTLLPCGHIYHEYCLQHHEYKCLYCLKYIKNQININVESIINRLTSKKIFQ